MRTTPESVCLDHHTYQWRLLEAILIEFKRQTDVLGAELIVALLPATQRLRTLDLVVGSGFEHRFETPDGPFTFRTSEPRERLTAISERTGIRLWDPTAEFADAVVRLDLVEKCWPSMGDRRSLARFDTDPELAPILEQAASVRRLQGDLIAGAGRDETTAPTRIPLRRASFRAPIRRTRPSRRQ